MEAKSIHEDSPVGSIFPYVGSTGFPPQGFVFCNGLGYGPSVAPLLFDVIGYDHGGSVEDGYFRVPDYRSSVLAQTGGGVIGNAAVSSNGLYLDAVPTHTHPQGGTHHHGDMNGNFNNQHTHYLAQTSVVAPNSWEIWTRFAGYGHWLEWYPPYPPQAEVEWAGAQYLTPSDSYTNASYQGMVGHVMGAGLSADLFYRDQPWYSVAYIIKYKH